MNQRSRRLAGTVLTAAVLCTLAACSSDSETTSEKPAAGPSTKEEVTKSARDYMHAWMAVEPSDGKTMCELQTKAARPNFDEDGGTLKGCIAEHRQNSSDSSDDANRAPLRIAISRIQDVPASDTHPAGKGVLATMHRTGEDQFRYVLRLVKEGEKWLIEQNTDVGDRYAHTADPVAPLLAQME